MRGIILMFLFVYLIELGSCKVDINIDQYMKTKTGASLTAPDPAKCLNRECFIEILETDELKS